MLIDKILGIFSQDVGIDLGTANTLVYVKGKGIVIRESSVVAINQKTKKILAIGDEAKKMVGRTPAYIIAHRPLVDGVVSDFEITEQMLRYFIEKVHRDTFTIFPRPKVVIGIPYGVTEVERRAVDREVAVSGEIIAKYSQMGAGLTVVRSVDRMILVDVGEEIEQRLLRNEYLFNPRAPIRRDIGKIGSLCTLLGQTRVRPYRPIAIEARGVLDWTQQLLGANRQEELFELGLPDYLRGLAWGFRNILDNHDDISSENS